MHSGMRGKATAVSHAGRENSESVAKQKQQPSAGLAKIAHAQHAQRAPRRSPE